MGNIQCNDYKTHDEHLRKLSVTSYVFGPIYLIFIFGIIFSLLNDWLEINMKHPISNLFVIGLTLLGLINSILYITMSAIYENNISGCIY